MKNVFFLFLSLVILFIFNCFPYVYYDQNKVLINGIDIDQTLEVAKVELDKGGVVSVLGIWVIRDQIIKKDQAAEISKLYFNYINKLNSEFPIWHLAWAISNLYRNGDNEVKQALLDAYNDAKKRPETLKQFKGIANLHINGDKIYMGDIHDLGRSYAKSHIVVPGNKSYLQSFEEYISKK